jgi:hypothetical protein
MTQVLQLLTVLAVGFGLACYGLIQDRKEHAADPRQANLFPDAKVPDHEDHRVLTGV